MRGIEIRRSTVVARGLLPGLFILAVLSWTAPVRAGDAVRSIPSVARHVAEAAQRFAIPESWIYGVMRVESAGDPRAVSRKGAAGLMQLMPSTWSELRNRYGLGIDIYDARDNILAGTAYLRELYDRYGAPGFLAAYNAGPARYESYRRSGRPLPAETVSYVARLSPTTAGGNTAAASIDRPDPLDWTRSAVFASRASTVGSPAVDRSISSVSTGPDRDVVLAMPQRHNIFVPLSGLLAR